MKGQKHTRFVATLNKYLELNPKVTKKELCQELKIVPQQLNNYLDPKRGVPEEFLELYMKHLSVNDKYIYLGSLPMFLNKSDLVVIDSTKMTEGARIKAIITKSDLTQLQLAKILNIKQEGISAIINGKSKITWEQVKILVKELNINPLYIAGFSDEMNLSKKQGVNKIALQYKIEKLDNALNEIKSLLTK